MTLEEKIDYIGGYAGFNIRAVPRLDMPEIRMADGPMGLRVEGVPATAYPADIALAATWNLRLAKAMARGMARDARARGIHIVLVPGVNLHRSPLCGRNFEYLGEDPHLASRFAVRFIRSMQGEGVAATVKHFAANNQEYDRNRVSSDLDERTLRELYLPAFEAAVREAKVACVMNGYNLVNGIHCTEHDELNNRILKGEWKFDGVLMSDWDSTWDAVGAANGGLDLEMPSGKFMNRANLLPALEDGRVKLETIDDKVRRILRMAVRMGFFERPEADLSIPLYDPSTARIALDIARESIVLLKNEGPLLPLDRKALRRIAVIGPNAHPAVWGGGGSSRVVPFRTVSVLDAVTALAGPAVEVHYDSGGLSDDPAPLFKNAVFTHLDADGAPREGLWAEYFATLDLTGDPVVKRVDLKAHLDWERKREDWLPAEGFSIRWTGRIEVPASALCAFATRCDDGIRVWLDGELIIDDWSIHPPRVTLVARRLEAGRPYDVRIEYFDAGGGAVAQFGWGPVPDPAHSTAVRLAKEMDAVVMCVGFNERTEGENSDRTFELPPGQAELIRAVADANPRTIVVLNAGGAVATEGWLGQVPALLHTWYPGQEGGTALAEILFGRINPSGKLPCTFEKRLEDNLSTPYYHASDGSTVYREGVMVGYRGFDHHSVEPLFPFGHGLSYTAFEYRGLQIEIVGRGAKAKMVVCFEVANSGLLGGLETAQVYVEPLDDPDPLRPVRVLAGFIKVKLARGRKRVVRLRVDPAAFSIFDVERKHRRAVPGRYRLHVGASSRDLRLQSDLTLQS